MIENQPQKYMAKIDLKLIRLMCLCRKLEGNPEATREQLCTLISEELNARGYRSDISISTLNRDINELRSLGVDIEYNRTTQKYKIDPSPEWKFFLELISPLKVLTAMGKDAGVPEFIFPEQYESKGLDHLDQIITAIRSRLPITFEHYKYQDETWRERTLKPEALKEWRGRWYVLGITEAGERRVFGLDRIRELRLGHRASGQRADLNPYIEAFRDSFGIYASEDFPIEELILHFDREDGNYLRSRPLHSSQEIIDETDQEVSIRLKLRITADLKMELLSRANSIRIEQPTWLREECCRIWSEALKRNQLLEK